MKPHSDDPLNSRPPPGFRLEDANRQQLIRFLDEIANTPLKVKILFYFLNQPTLCISSCDLAQRLGTSELLIQTAAKELAACGTFSYCPYFAYTDLCHLAATSYSNEIQSQLHLLFTALRFEPDFVWNYFGSSLNP